LLWLPSPKKEAREDELCLWCLSSSPPKMEREELWCLSLWCLSSVTPKSEAAMPGRWEEERWWLCRLRDEERLRERCLWEDECLDEWCLWCLECVLRPETTEAASSRRPMVEVASRCGGECLEVRWCKSG